MPRESSFLWAPTGNPNGPVIVSRDRYNDPAPLFPAPVTAPSQQHPLFLEYRSDLRAPAAILPSSSSASEQYPSLEYYQTEYRRPSQSKTSSRRHEVPPPRVINYPQGYDPYTVPPAQPSLRIPDRPRVLLPAPLLTPVVAPQPEPTPVPPPAPDVPPLDQRYASQRYFTPAGEPVREAPPSLRVNIPTPPSSYHSRQGSESSPLSPQSTSPRSHRSRGSGASSGHRRHRRADTPDTPVSSNSRRSKGKKMIEEANYQPLPWKDAAEVSWKDRDGSRTTQYRYR